jgi:hypothetical protein
MKCADLDQFENTAAWLEYCDGMTRFQAETEAARRQGLQRWEIINAKRNGNFERGGNNRQAMAGQQRPDAMPGLQPASEKENGTMPERDAQAGRSGLALSSLRNEQWGVL